MDAESNSDVNLALARCEADLIYSHIIEKIVLYLNVDTKIALFQVLRCNDQKDRNSLDQKQIVLSIRSK